MLNIAFINTFQIPIIIRHFCHKFFFSTFTNRWNRLVTTTNILCFFLNCGNNIFLLYIYARFRKRIRYIINIIPAVKKWILYISFITLLKSLLDRLNSFTLGYILESHEILSANIIVRGIVIKNCANNRKQIIEIQMPS